MVAAASEIRIESLSSSKFKNNICTQPVRICRILEEFAVKMSGHPHPFIKKLSKKKKKLVKDLVFPFYKAKADKYWSFYTTFCKKLRKKDFRKSLVVTQVIKAIKKKVSNDKTPNWLCDPLLIVELRHYIDILPF
ncbi:20277_t:CDS:2 [Cetraspora pellucida]|uniref:20277_t:CDS:1 n=1 Tax=Cetraspora pellucida TaxID=1433469 RepID=A0A9N8VJX4_9GLOM|nr:20277_t:CDS:2 [Cetraspora pellucida]